MQTFRIRKAVKEDAAVLAALACALWPSHTRQEMEKECVCALEEANTAFFLAYGENEAIGFAQCQLRRDYVEGTQTSPVGYLEGIYVDPGCRHMGAAKQLLAVCEDWAKNMGCTEFASDCELTNLQSLQFHLKVGFLEANRIICFAKKI